MTKSIKNKQRDQAHLEAVLGELDVTLNQLRALGLLLNRFRVSENPKHWYVMGGCGSLLLDRVDAAMQTVDRLRFEPHPSQPGE